METPSYIIELRFATKTIFGNTLSHQGLDIHWQQGWGGQGLEHEGTDIDSLIQDEVRKRVFPYSSCGRQG